MKRIYIAGPLSDMPSDYLCNVGAMIEAWRDINETEDAVAFCPATDILLGLWNGCIGGRAFAIADYHRWSMAWLEVCDAVFVLSDTHRDGRLSGGVAAEIERAGELGIPVLRNPGELRAFLVAP